MPVQAEWISRLQRFFNNTHVFFALKVLVAMLGCLLPALLGHRDATVLMTLGVVAGAIGEPDDSVPGRAKNLLMTMLCFVIATVSVQLLYPYPPLFALGLFSSTFGFIMLGALGPRYATISFGSLLVAIYSMLGAAHATNLWFQPLWLCIGAFWYGCVSLLWLKLLPHKPVHEQLAQLFLALGDYLNEKSRLFPVPPGELSAIRHQLAQLNSRNVHSMQLTRTMLSGRLSAGWTPHLERLLQLYLLSQEIHERCVASHWLYDKLADELAEHAILGGFREALRQEGQNLHQLGYAILLHREFRPSDSLVWLIQALQDQRILLQQRQQLPAELSSALEFLHQNLAAILGLLHDAALLTGHFDDPIDNVTQRKLARPYQAAFRDVEMHIRKATPLLRHALRMATTLCVGYGLLQWFDIKQGFWVLLTCLFVCQSSFSATRRRVFERIGGTLFGLLLGAPLFWFGLPPGAQLAGMILAAVLFFSQLRNNYSAAVTFITLYALTAFSLLGSDSELLMLPRLIDTLLGSALAFTAVMWLWPEWQHRRLPDLIIGTLEANRTYLRHVLEDEQGEQQELTYRIVRRQAHLADSALAEAWQNMLAEPRAQQRWLTLCASMTQRSHTLLSFISTLGAHRQRIRGQLSTEQRQLAAAIDVVLADAALMLQTRQGGSEGKTIEVTQWPRQPEMDSAQWLIQQELEFIAEQSNELLRLSWLTPSLKLAGTR